MSEVIRSNSVYFGADDKPVLNKTGMSRASAVFDERGNITEEAYFGVDGRPVLRSDFGVARTTYRYDERGHEIEQVYFEIDGKPTPNKNGLSRITAVYDERGNEVEDAYFGIDGKPILGDGGYARVTHRYDDRGEPNRIGQFRNGWQTNPRQSGWRFARYLWLRRARQEGGRNIFRRANGKPVLGDAGYARVTYRYDERGNEVEEAYFGVERTDSQSLVRKDTPVRHCATTSVASRLNGPTLEPTISALPTERVSREHSNMTTAATC